MRRIAAVFLVPIALWLSGCAGITQTTGAGSGNTCEAKVVRAMISPNKPVAGAFACIDSSQNPAFAESLVSHHISDDRGLAAYAAEDPAYTAAKLCPNRPASLDASYRIYELSGALSGHQLMRLHITKDGKVDGIVFALQNTRCADIPA